MDIGNGYVNPYGKSDASGIAAKKLQNKLANGMEDATDEEMLEACKEFEAYLVEQVIKQMEKTVIKSEEDGEYVEVFGDYLTQGYAQAITEQGSMGIAQQLYESMKNNMNATRFTDV